MVGRSSPRVGCWGLCGSTRPAEDSGPAHHERGGANSLVAPGDPSPVSAGTPNLPLPLERVKRETREVGWGYRPELGAGGGSHPHPDPLPQGRGRKREPSLEETRDAKAWVARVEGEVG